MRNFNRRCVVSAGLLLLLLTVGGGTLRAQSTPLPLINQPLLPDTVAPGGPGFTLTVNGTGFVSTSVVQWNNTPLATTFVSSSQLSASVPASDIAVPGTATVTVFSSGGGTSNGMFFPVANAASSSAFSEANWSVRFTQNVTAGDFNGDGYLDLAVAEYGPDPGQVGVLLGNGNGTFGPVATFPTGVDSVVVC